MDKLHQNIDCNRILTASMLQAWQDVKKNISLLKAGFGSLEGTANARLEGRTRIKTATSVHWHSHIELLNVTHIFLQVLIKASAAVGD